MQETEQQHQFYRSMTLGLSAYLIFVVNKATALDQRFFRDLANRWVKCSQDGMCRCIDIFVIHNFKDVSNREEAEKLFKVYKHSFENPIALYSNRFHCLHTQLNTTKLCVFYKSIFSQMKGVSCFDCPQLHTRHIFPMNETNWDYNNAVFELLTEKFLTILMQPQDPYTPETLSHLFAECCSKLLSKGGFLTNVKEIQQVTEENGQTIYKPVKLEENLPVAQTSSYDKNFVPTLHPQVRY